MLYAVVWMNFEDIILSEVSHSQRTNTACFHLYAVSKVVKLLAAGSRILVAKGLGEGEMGSCCSMSIDLQSCKMKNSGDLITTMFI